MGWAVGKWVGVSIAVAALAGMPTIAIARAKAVRPPVLGDWEGTGPNGLPLSFILTRVHGRISVSELTVGDPLFCPGRFAPTLANPFPQALYIGPGALPRVRINWRPTEIDIRVGMGAPFAPEWDGRLLGPRLMTLSEPAPINNPPGCGWSSRRLTWRATPAQRMPVTPGVWSGTVTGAGGTGTVSVKVAASGRIVENFEVSVSCTEGGGGTSEIGPAAVGEFISAAGTFSDANRPAGFEGRFEPGGTLTGTLTGSYAQGCAPGGSLGFTAHPG